nr:endonuclease domain-containing 1 protein-like isoform X2 [Misgurnus anguillicaudatus]
MCREIETHQTRQHFSSLLEEDFAGINMELKGRRVLNKQATNKDYKNSGYDKGHLAPVYHADSQPYANATFTLTNAAPQLGSFNKQWFHKVESNMVETVKKHCTQNTAHIVTGVVPGIDNIFINDKVRVPSHFWTAYCCKNQTNKLISGGVIGGNSQGSTIDPKTVKNLETDLKTGYSVRSFLLFDNNCRDAAYVPVIPQ